MCRSNLCVKAVSLLFSFVLIITCFSFSVVRAADEDFDITVTSVQLKSSDVYDGDYVMLTATLRNQGSGTVPSGVPVQFTVSGRVIDEIVTDREIASGKKLTVTGNKNWKAIFGSHILRARVNASKELAETDYGNNTINERVSVVDEQRPLPGNKKPYTFAWMTDTQFYSQEYPEIYDKMTEWIADNAQSQNIKYVFHTGDVTNWYAYDNQWKNADASMKKLDGKVPYSILAGNHDVGFTANDYTQYLQYFGEKRFADDKNAEWYEGGKASAKLLTVGNRQFLMLALGYHPDDGMIAWANAKLKEHPTTPAIFTTHSYMNTDGSLNATGQSLFDKIIKPNPNVCLVLCGHNHSAEVNIANIDDNGDGKTDRTVYQLMADYQATENGGNGYLRLLTVDENKQQITVRTYSPYLDKYDYFDPAEYPEKDEFVIPMIGWPM